MSARNLSRRAAALLACAVALNCVTAVPSYSAPSPRTAPDFKMNESSFGIWTKIDTHANALAQLVPFEDRLPAAASHAAAIESLVNALPIDHESSETAAVEDAQRRAATSAADLKKASASGNALSAERAYDGLKLSLNELKDTLTGPG